MNHSIFPRQRMTLAFVAALSPFLRLIPGQITRISGGGSWLTPLFFLPCLLLLALFLVKFLQSPTGAGGMIPGVLRVLGKGWGSFLLLLFGGWLLFLSGFALRSGADRLIATIFPNSSPWPFLIVMELLCLLAVMGPAKILARSAEIFRPLLMLTLVLVIAAFLPRIRPEYLLPIRFQDLPQVGQGSLLMTECLGVGLLIVSFLEPPNQGCVLDFRRIVRWLLEFSLLTAAVCAVTVGIFGPKLTGVLSYPFFTMIWDLELLNMVERIEAIIVGLWLLPDFILTGLEITVAAQIFLELTGQKKRTDRRIYWRGSGKLLWLCVALSTLSAVLITKDPQEMTLWAGQIIPGVNLAFCIGLPLLLFIAAKLRKLL